MVAKGDYSIVENQSQAVSHLGGLKVPSKAKRISANNVVYFISGMVATNIDNDTISELVEQFFLSLHAKDFSYNIQQLDIKKLDGFKPTYTKKVIPELA